MAVIVAVLGVINTLAMSVFERSQEIGMLRAIGLDRRGVKRMVRLESLVISLFGGVLGIGLGVFFGWAAGELIGRRDADLRAGAALGPDRRLPRAGRAGRRPGGAVAGPPGGPAEHADRHQGGVAAAERRERRARTRGGPAPARCPAVSSRSAGAQRQPRAPRSPGSARRGPG